MNLPLCQLQAYTRAAAFALTLALAAGAAQATGSDSDADGACASHLGTLPAARGQTLSEHLNILSWNIQKTHNQGWREDLLRLAGDADLTFLQEATLQAHLGELWPAGPLYQSFAAGYATPRQQTGVMTLSSRAPTMLCNFSHREPWLGTPKAVAVTEHAIAGRPERLLAINFHAVNFTLGLRDLRGQLTPLVELLARHPGPVILAGDFNTWSAARARLVDETLRASGLRPLTFEPDLRSTAFGRALDHIYVRGVIAEQTRVIPVSSSDHNVLLARLQVST